jgi:Ala-tRNA(Pro) deacylase
MNATVKEKIKSLLDENKIEYQLLEHEPVYTSEQASRIRGTDISMGAKALVFYADRIPVLIVVPGDKKADLKKFKKTFSVKDLMIMSPDEVFNLTGLKVGSIPPFGNVLNLPAYFDKSFENKERVAFNAGDHKISIIMKASDLILLVHPRLGDFAI